MTHRHRPLMDELFDEALTPVDVEEVVLRSQEPELEELDVSNLPDVFEEVLGG